MSEPNVRETEGGALEREVAERAGTALVAELLIAEKAGRLHMMSVHPCNCPEGCGVGPRFLIYTPAGRYGVENLCNPTCYNLDELRAQLALTKGTTKHVDEVLLGVRKTTHKTPADAPPPPFVIGTRSMLESYTSYRGDGVQRAKLMVYVTIDGNDAGPHAVLDGPLDALQAYQRGDITWTQMQAQIKAAQ